MFTDPSYQTPKKGQDFYYISTIDNKNNGRDFLFTSFVKDKGSDFYFVYDKVPTIEWKIEEGDTKKILGYECTKATANFRGSPITAYFTKQIPYSVGPFKFYGLPGAILDVRVDGKNYDLWKAVKVDTKDTSKIDYKPQFSNYNKANMKDFIELKDAEATRFSNSITVPGSTGIRIGKRFGVEKQFEWENKN
jgi:GLPGLI family protein